MASIRISGDLSSLESGAWIRLRSPLQIGQQPQNQIRFGLWVTVASESAEHEITEEIVFCRTGETEAEVHCHGGVAAVDRILGDLKRFGVQVLPNEAMPEISAETPRGVCQRAILKAPTERTVSLLLPQVSLWEREAQKWKDGKSTRSWLSRKAEIERWSEFARHLTVPWNVVLCGPPNVGKSSLMNAMAGFSRSIVHHQAGTTRDVVRFDTAFDGWPVQLSDTAGIRDTADLLEAEGVRRARAALGEADLTILVCDATAQSGREDDAIPFEGARRRLKVINKIDLAEGPRSAYPADSIAVSARTGEGLQPLMAAIVTSLIPELPPADLPLLVSDDLWRFLPTEV